MYEAAVKGLTWRVISAEAMTVPGLADLIQAGCNTGAQLACNEREWQILKRILNLIKQSGQQVSYQQVKANIMRTKPQCAQTIPDMFSFLVRYGASPAQHARLLETENRIKASTLESRNLGPDFFRALSGEAKDPKQESFVPFRHSLLSLAYAGSGRHLVGAQDAKKVTAKDEIVVMKLQLAQSLMKRVRKLFVGLKVEQMPNDVAMQCYGALHDFEDTVVLMALDKKVHVKVHEQAACEMVDKIEQCSGVKMTTDYDSFRQASANPGAAGSSSGAMLTLGCNL